jgi:hypothetical protein
MSFFASNFPRHWSSTTNIFNPGVAWGIDFLDGFHDNISVNKTNTGNTRCVRQK